MQDHVRQQIAQSLTPLYTGKKSAVLQASLFNTAALWLGQGTIEILIYDMIGFAEIGYVFEIRQTKLLLLFHIFLEMLQKIFKVLIPLMRPQSITINHRYPGLRRESTMGSSMSTKSLFTALVITIPILAFAAGENASAGTEEAKLLLKQAHSLLAEASRLSYYASYDRSIAVVAQAKDLFEELMAGHSDSTAAAGLARCILLLGKNYRIKSDVALAKQFLHPGLDSCGIWFGEKSPLVAAFYEELGQLYMTIGDSRQFLHYAQEGLNRRRKLYREDHPEIAESLNSVGKAEMYLEQFESAKRHFDQALAIRIAQKPEQKLQMAESYYSLYQHAARCNDYGGILDYAQRSLAYALAAVGENHPLVAECYIGIGNYNYFIDNADKALEYYRRAHDILVRLFGPVHYRTIATLTNMAACYAEKGDYAEAIEHHHQARKVTWQLYGENAWYANSCTYLGQVYATQKKYQEALYWYDKSLEVHQKLGVPLPVQLRLQYNEMARIFLAQNKPLLCLECLEKTFNSFHPIPILDPTLTPEQGRWPADDQFLTALCLRAEALQQSAASDSNPLHPLSVALDSYRIALTAFERTPLVLLSGDAILHSTTSRHSAPIFDGAVQSALTLYERTGRADFQEAAFEFVQKGKAAVLAHSLQEADAKSFAGIPEEISQKESMLNQRLGKLSIALMRAEQQGVEIASQEYQKLRASYFDLQDEQRQLIDRLEQDYPGYHALKYQTFATTVTEQQASMDTETALLDFYMSDSTLHVFAITADRFTAQTCGSAPETVNLINAFRAALKSDNRKGCQQLGSLLYQQLIMPVWPVIGEKKNLVIFPHDKLFEIPFEALVTSVEGSKKPTYLLHHFQISYHYSCRTYSQMVKDRKRNLQPTETDLIAFAPFSSNTTVVIPDKNLFKSYLAMSQHPFAWLTRDGENFCELPGSEVEVDEIAAAFAAQKAKSVRYFGPQATKETFKKAVKTARYVHLATHSFINDSSPSLSGIAFFNSPSLQADEREDSTILYAGEVYNLELNADLVVLSSCESGIGKLIKGEGMIALTRGFLYAGARNVMVSLWKVSDQSATDLMPEFYRRVLEGESYSAALRSAKLGLLKKNKNASPAMWGCFILYGR